MAFKAGPQNSSVYIYREENSKGPCFFVLIQPHNQLKFLVCSQEEEGVAHQAFYCLGESAQPVSLSFLSGPTASLIVLLQGSTRLWEHYLIPTGLAGVLCILTLNLNTNNIFSIPYPGCCLRLGYLRALVQPGVWTYLYQSWPRDFFFFSPLVILPAVLPHLLGGKAENMGQGQKLWKLEGKEGKSSSCSCQQGDKCKEIHSYLQSKWGRDIRQWNVNA